MSDVDVKEDSKHEMLKSMFNTCKNALQEHQEEMHDLIVEKEENSKNLFYTKLNTSLKSEIKKLLKSNSEVDLKEIFYSIMKKAGTWSSLTINKKKKVISKKFRNLFTHKSFVEVAKKEFRCLMKSSDNYDNRFAEQVEELKKKVGDWFKTQKKLTLITNDNNNVALQYEVLLPKSGWKEYVVNSKKKPQTFKNFDLNQPSTVNISLESKCFDKKIIKLFMDIEKKKIAIEMYEKWLDDLLNLFNPTNASKLIYPIFVPSKKRAKFFSSSFLGNISPLANSNCLIYLVVEEQELVDYVQQINIANTKFDERIVFISIPGENRGMGFARSCIKLIQEKMREICLEKKGFLFNYFWMIDDDIQETRIFENSYRQSFGSMRSCPIDIVLENCQNAMKQIVEEKDKRVLKKECQRTTTIEFFEGLKQLSLELVDALFGTDNLHRFANTFFYGNFFTNFEVVKELLRLLDCNDCQGAWDLITRIANINEDMPDWFIDWFRNVKFASEEAKKNTDIAQLSVARSIVTTKRNYNLEEDNTHYKVSDDMKGLILTYVPALIGYNYLPFDKMFISQQDVDLELATFISETYRDRERRYARIRAGHKDRSGNVYKYQYRDYFVKEDERLMETLRNDGKIGVLIFFFDAVYKSKLSGGCDVFL
ncbi:hypothetical protein ABK040_013490 [Willaertia magna]